MNTNLANTGQQNEFVTWREFLSSSHSSSLALVCLAVWLHAADSLIVATMLPSMVANIGGAKLIGWSVSLYEIGSITAGAASALLTMRLALRVPMTGAAIMFGLGCLVSATSPTMPVVLVGRTLQGLGGGGLVAMSFIAVNALFPRRFIARALGAVSTLWGVSAFLGPVVGGVFVEFATWRWAFGFFALQAFGLALWIAVRRGREPAVNLEAIPSFPFRRLALLCFSVVLISLAGVRVEPLQTPAFVAAGLICLTAFLLLDSRASDHRLLPYHPLDPRHSPGAALLMILSLSIATIGITAYGPILISAIHGSSPLTAGYVVACSSIGWTVMAVSVSGSPERRDRWFIAFGMIAAALSVVGFAYSVPNGPVWLIAIFAALEGGGFGMAWTFVLRRATAFTSHEESRRISGAIPTLQRMGYAIGAAYLGIIANSNGFPTMRSSGDASHVGAILFIACLPFAAIGLVAMCFLISRRSS